MCGEIYFKTMTKTFYFKHLTGYLFIFILAKQNLIAQNLLLKDVQILSINQAEISKPTQVYVENGVVRYIGNKPIKTKTGTKIYPAKGKILTFGMQDMHVHFPNKDLDADTFLALFTKAGVTHIRSMRGSGYDTPFRQDSLKANYPNLYLASPIVGVNTFASRAQILEKLMRVKQKGYDLIKVFALNDTLAYDFFAIADSLKLKTAGHYLANIPLEKQVQNRYCIEHLGGYDALDSLRLQDIITQLKTQNTYISPTLFWYFLQSGEYSLTELESQDGFSFVPKPIQAKWRQNYAYPKQVSDSAQRALAQKLNVLKQMADAGVLLLFSPDASSDFAVPGFSMFAEMRLWQKAGLSNQQILRAMMLNPLKYWHENASMDIAVGSGANFLLLSKNPLQDLNALQNIDAVIVNGSVME
jgi:hypothetical protein